MTGRAFGVHVVLVVLLGLVLRGLLLLGLLQILFSLGDFVLALGGALGSSLDKSNFLGLGSGAVADILDGIVGELFAVFLGSSGLVHLLNEIGGRQIGEGLATVKVLWHDGVRVRKSRTLVSCEGDEQEVEGLLQLQH